MKPWRYLLYALILWPQVAQAHSPFPLNDFYNGALELIFHVDLLLPLLAIVILAATRSKKQALALVAGFVGAATVALLPAIWLGYAAPLWLMMLATLLPAMLVALSLRLSTKAERGLVALLGGVFVFAALGGSSGKWLFGVGVWAGLLFLSVFLVGILVGRKDKITPIAMRVLSSWLVAISLLRLALLFAPIR